MKKLRFKDCLEKRRRKECALMKAAIQPCAAYVTAENKHFWTVNNISQLEQRQREEQKYRIVICLQNKRSRENWYME